MGFFVFGRDIVIREEIGIVFGLSLGRASGVMGFNA